MNSTEMYAKCMRNVAECLQDRTPGALPERRHAVRLRCGTLAAGMCDYGAERGIESAVRLRCGTERKQGGVRLWCGTGDRIGSKITVRNGGRKAMLV